jgi:two-component system CheB/CheR fusion protein
VRLQSIIEDQETINEELKSANEEVLSSNEELQSTNEELETAKEELQSTNEELVTLNEQIQNRNTELGQVNDDLANLLSGVNIPIVMLGMDRRIRRFTPLAEALLNLLPGDVGRPIDNIRPNVEVPDLGRMITEVIGTAGVRHVEVQDHGGRWHSLVLRPYRTLDNKIDGVVMIFIDIDALKRAHVALEAEKASAVPGRQSDGARDRADGRSCASNRACQRVTGSPRSQEDPGTSCGAREREEVKGSGGLSREVSIENESHWVDRNERSASLPDNRRDDGCQGAPRHFVGVGVDIPTPADRGRRT